MAANDQRQIDGETRLMGVLGENIAYTRSPRLHNTAANELGLNIVYLPLPMPAAQVGPFLDAAWHMGAVGFNVTTPHKALVASLIASTPLTSVNTLYRGPEGWLAASTDGEGFDRGLRRIGASLGSFHDVIVLGSGGAVVAILAHLGRLPKPRPKVQVLRRSSAHDQLLKEALPPSVALTLTGLNQAELKAALAGRDGQTLLIQGTSAPQRGDDLAELVPALEDFRGVVVDLIYGRPSALYHAAVARGLAAQDGAPMLIEQARLAQRLWWGQAASYESMATALLGE